MKIKIIFMFTAISFLSSLSFAEDWTISAQGSCRTSLGNTSNSGGGLRASGTAVVICPLTKEAGTNTINNVYARIKRASATGPDAFCYLVTKNNYGTPSSFTNTFSNKTTNNQSLNVTLPTQYSLGYADLYCVLMNDDTLFGVRYRQDN